MNSHDFKYSMIPFSEYNMSRDVNLYDSSSKVPYLFKDSVPATSHIHKKHMSAGSPF